MPRGWRRYRDTHTHPCAACGAPVLCYGVWEPNPDGCPEVICSTYHLPNGETAQLFCGMECYMRFRPSK